MVKFELNLISFIKRNYLLILILLFALFIRFYRLEQMADYDFDQEYVTNFVLDVVREYPIRYAGQGLSIQGLFMGAWYFYFLVPWYLLTSLNPLGGFIGSVFLGLLTVFTYYFVSKEIFSKRVGLISAFLRAVGFYAISIDWAMTPAFSSDLFVLLIWYCFYKIYKKEDKYFYFLALIFGLLTSFHIIQLPFYLVLLILLIVWKTKITKKILFPSFLMFLLPNIPLILFDYWRNWAMANQILSMISGGGGGNSFLEKMEKLKTMLWVVLDFFGDAIQVSYSRFLVIILFLSSLILLKVFIRKNKKFHFPALISSFAIFILYYTALPIHVPEYYLGGLRAIMLLYISFLLHSLIKNKLAKYFVFFFFSYYFLMSSSQIYKKWTNSKLTTFGNKESIVLDIISDVGEEDFTISYIVKPGWGSGFDSLFRLHNRVSSGKGNVYTIVVPTDLLNENEIDLIRGDIGLIYPK